jgi:hypothetical protein
VATEEAAMTEFTEPDELAYLKIVWDANPAKALPVGTDWGRGNSAGGNPIAAAGVILTKDNPTESAVKWALLRS